MVSTSIRKRYDDRGAYIHAFIVMFSLLMLIGVSVIVGTSLLSPRLAALAMILPAALLASLGGRIWIVRRVFCAVLFS